jgi:hypothetical protein
MLAYVLIPLYPVVPYLVVLLLATWWAQTRSGDAPLARWLAVEELVIGGAIWALAGAGPGAWKVLYLAAAEAARGWTAVVYLVGLTALALAGLRVPLPEWLFPVRGRWLRALLATLAVGGLLAAGPWWWLATMSWLVGSESSPGYGLVYRATAITLPVCVLLYAATLWRRLAAPPPAAAAVPAV